QRFLGRIVDIGAELFAISATCVRTRMLVDDRAPAAEEAGGLAGRFGRGGGVSAGAPAAGSTGSATTCGPTTTPATTRPPSASCAATTPGWRRASSTTPAPAVWFPCGSARGDAREVVAVCNSA